MHDHDTAGTSAWWDLALLPGVKVLTEAVSPEASAVHTAVRRGAGVWSVATERARVATLAVAFARITAAVPTAALRRAQIDTSVVHFQGKAVVARDAFGRSVLGARGPGARLTIGATANVRFAHGVDSAAAVALSAQALKEVDAIHTRGFGASALHSSTLVHVFTNFVAASADPSLGAKALEPVLLVDTVAFATTDYVPASFF